MGIKYELPQFLESTDLKRGEYAHWLHRKAQSHARRDGRRWGKKISASEYKQAIHEAVLGSDGLDFYTREPLEWSRIGKCKYNNDEAEQGGIEYRKKLARLPTVDHEDPEADEPVLRICGMQTNDCKSNLNLEEFKDFCRKFLAAQDSGNSPTGSS